MKFKPNDIFKKYPDIEDIAIRLEESERQARERNSKKTDTGTMPGPEAGSKRVFQYCPEHSVISDFYKEGRWEQTPFTLKPGREAFLKDLAKVLETRDPDAIRIQIYAGKRRSGNPTYTKEIYFSDVPQQERGSGENEETLHKKMDETLSEAKKGGSSELQIELLRKDFEAKLKEQQHQTEITRLQDEIKDKDEYIEELEAEIEEKEGELNGIEEEKESAGEIILARVLVQAGENLLKNNPKIMKIGLGLTDEEIKKIFENDPPKLEAAKSENDNSGFTESKDDYAGLDEKHVQGIKELVAFFKQISTEEFKKLFTIDCLLQDEKTGMLNNSLADKVLELVKTTVQNTPEKK